MRQPDDPGAFRDPVERVCELLAAIVVLMLAHLVVTIL
jgi:hypothetical protein